MGDFFARVLGLGHIRGLPILAVVLLGVFLLERRDKVVHQAYYWCAIIIVRTAATNLADLAASDMKQPRLLVMGALAIALVAVLLWRRSKFAATIQTNSTSKASLLDTDSKYWVCMLIAGTLGTVLGDFAAGDASLGLANASVMLSFVVGLVFYFGRGRLQTTALYWSTIVMVRAAGTTVGDFLASNRGVALGLSLSTALTGLLFIVALIAWKESPANPDSGRRSRNRAVTGSDT
jgi:uncharacterized membrane-anchored protein